MAESDSKENKIRTGAVFTPYTKTELTPEQLARLGENLKILKHIMARERTPTIAPTPFPYTLSFGSSITDIRGKYEKYGRGPKEIITRSGESISFSYLAEHPEDAARHELYCEFDEKKIDAGKFEQTTKIIMLSKAAMPFSVRFLFENICSNSSSFEQYMIHYELSPDGRIEETKNNGGHDD